MKHTLHATGMHCTSCTLLIKDTVSTIQWVDDVIVDLHHQTVEIHCHSELMPNQLTEQVNRLLQEYWYTLHTTKPPQPIKRNEYLIAVVITALLLYALIRAQDLGLLNLIQSETRTYGSSLLIGFVASLSSCLAIVGWIVLALGVAISKETQSSKPQWMFHIWRLWWFFLLWWVLGLVGAAMQLSPLASTILNLIIWTVLFVFGLNLLGVIRQWITLSWGIFGRFTKRWWLVRWPFLVGVGTFFAPCGFTQSMQLYTLTTWSFVVWWLTMLSFALGTLPMLLLLSFGGKSIQGSRYSWVFFKIIWFLLLVFWLYTISNNLTLLGVAPPLFSL